MKQFVYNGKTLNVPEAEGVQATDGTQYEQGYSCAMISHDKNGESCGNTMCADCIMDESNYLAYKAAYDKGGVLK